MGLALLPYLPDTTPLHTTKLSYYLLLPLTPANIPTALGRGHPYSQN